MAGALGRSELEDLEDMIDRSSLEEVLVGLAQICYEKAEHLRSNWQDEGAARIWERDAKKLDALAAKVQT